MLDEMSKQELIYFMRKSFYRLPPKSELLFYRWQIKTEEHQEKSKLHGEKLNKIDFKKRDELAKQFNKSTDSDERMKLIKQLVKFDNAFQAWSKEADQLHKEYERNSKLYEQINIQRELE